MKRDADIDPNSELLESRRNLETAYDLPVDQEAIGDGSNGDNESAVVSSAPLPIPTHRLPLNGRQKFGNSSELLDRQPPCDLAAERGLLGALLVTPNVAKQLATLNLQPRHFYDDVNKAVFSAIAVCLKRHGAVDLALIQGELPTEIDGVIRDGLLAELMSWGGIAANAPLYASNIIDAARRRWIQDFGCRLIQEAHNGKAAAEILEATAAELDYLKDQSGNRDAVNYDIRSAPELDDSDCTIQYDIDDVMPTGTPLVVAGGSKSMKTWLSAIMAFCLAMGLDFLDRFRVPQARNVLFFSAESGMAVLQRNLRLIAAAMGYGLSDCARLFISPNTVSFGNERHLAALEKICGENQIHVLFVDPLYLSLPGGDAGNLFIQGAYLRRVSEMCERLGITLAVVHHLRKNRPNGNQYDPPCLADIAWAGVGEWARAWVLIGRREDYKHDGIHRLWFETGGSAGHSTSLALDVDEGTKDNRRLIVNVSSANEVRQDVEARKAEAKRDEAKDTVEARKKAIVEALNGLPKGEGEVQKQINILAGINGDLHTRAAYKALAADKVIEPCMVKRTKQSYPGIRLRQEPRPEAEA